jgi:hypothetical protein
MKTIAKIVFKIHKLIYKYPCRSEVRLALDTVDSLGRDWFICMLYVCEENIYTIADWVDLTEEEVIEELNNVVKGLEF